jgi:hypothetical protein
MVAFRRVMITALSLLLAMALSVATGVAQSPQGPRLTRRAVEAPVSAMWVFNLGLWLLYQQHPDAARESGIAWYVCMEGGPNGGMVLSNGCAGPPPAHDPAR